MCPAHSLPYQQLWCVGWRSGPMASIVDALKFERVRAASKTLADLLDAKIPDIGQDIRVVPIPTTPHNIRLRGYDHMLLIGRELARRRGWRLAPLLSRRNNTTQHFTKSAAERRAQALEFFRINTAPTPDQTYLLIDDIFTTGSTLGAGAECLAEAGAKTILAAVIARQADARDMSSRGGTVRLD